MGMTNENLLLERLAIEDVFARYAHAGDEYDADGWVECFTEDGIFVKQFGNSVDSESTLNKPAGIAVQSGTKSRKNIIDILRETKEFSNSLPYTVHRIDKETTGVLIFAKNRKFAQLFTSLFRIRKIHKTYLAIVRGELLKKKRNIKRRAFFL